MSDHLLFDDAALRTTQTALDGLALRQQVISRNLANIDTPGYQAQTVTFEAALQQAQNTTGQPQPQLALAATEPAHLVGTTSAPIDPVAVEARQGGTQRVDGNNVDIDVELTQMAETGVRYQALTQLASNKLSLLRTISQGR